MYMPPVLSNLSHITTCVCKRLKVPPVCKKPSHVTLSVRFFEVPLRTLLFIPPKFQNSSSSHLLLFIRQVFGLPSPPPATPSDDMDIKRTSMLSSTTLTSQPLPTVVWIAEKSKKLAGFYPKSPSLVRAIPSTIFFDPGMIFQPLELFLLLVVLVRRNF
ncbi:unnamed protein product [Prunus brigantina]